MIRPASERPALARLLEGIRLAIFDCDGVLFESREANVAYYNAVLADLGFPPLTPEDEEFCHRSTTGQLFDRLFSAGSDLARRARRIAARLDYSPFYRLMTIDPAARPLLAALKESGCLTAMATNRGVTVPGLLAHFDLSGLFDLVVTSLDVEHPKPAPDMLLRCVERLNVPAERSLYVGDAEVDMEAARAAEVRFLAVGPLRACPGAERVLDLGEMQEALLPAPRRSAG